MNCDKSCTETKTSKFQKYLPHQVTQTKTNRRSGMIKHGNIGSLLLGRPPGWCYVSSKEGLSGKTPLKLDFLPAQTGFPTRSSWISLKQIRNQPFLLQEKKTCETYHSNRPWRGGVPLPFTTMSSA